MVQQFLTRKREGVSVAHLLINLFPSFERVISVRTDKFSSYLSNCPFLLSNQSSSSSYIHAYIHAVKLDSYDLFGTNRSVCFLMKDLILMHKIKCLVSFFRRTALTVYGLSPEDAFICFLEARLEKMMMLMLPK